MLTKEAWTPAGIERATGKSFHWKGEYLRDLNEADTLATDLNVFAEFEPKMPAELSGFRVFVSREHRSRAAGAVRAQMPKVKMVAGDTMNYWIGAHRENLLKVLRELDVLLINDKEAQMLSGETNGLRAAEAVMALGPKSLIVKHGEYGATAYFSERSFGDGVKRRPFRAPGLPLDEVVDPTGAGDSFAGGFYGYVASQRQADAGGVSHGDVLRQRDGLVCGGAFGTERLQRTTKRGDR